MVTCTLMWGCAGREQSPPGTEQGGLGQSLVFRAGSGPTLPQSFLQSPQCQGGRILLVWHVPWVARADLSCSITGVGTKRPSEPGGPDRPAVACVTSQGTTAAALPQAKDKGTPEPALPWFLSSLGRVAPRPCAPWLPHGFRFSLPSTHGYVWDMQTQTWGGHHTHTGFLSHVPHGKVVSHSPPPQRHSFAPSPAERLRET